MFRVTSLKFDHSQPEEWLRSEGCTHVAMESTGVYWKPIYAILEGAFQIVVANAQHVKKVPGRKTDGKDAEWIAGFALPRLAPPQLRSTLTSSWPVWPLMFSGSPVYSCCMLL